MTAKHPAFDRGALGGKAHAQGQLSGLAPVLECLAPTRASGEFGTNWFLNFLRNRCRPPPA